MRQFLVIAAALAGPATAQSATALTFWNPGPANNPSWYSKYGIGTTTYPPIASIVSSDPATTIFSLGCPSSIPASLSSIPNGDSFETCSWATDLGTYTIINSTRHVMHRKSTSPEFSAWWTCDYNTVATQVTCAMEVRGDVNDDTGGPISGWVFPDNAGNVVAFATASVVTEGRFGELDCGVGYDESSVRECNSDGTGGEATASDNTSATTKLITASGSAPAVTATQGSGVQSSVATRTASGSVATASAGTAAGFGVDSGALAALFGVAAFVAW